MFFGLPFEVDANQIEPFKIKRPDGVDVTQEEKSGEVPLLFPVQNFSK